MSGDDMRIIKELYLFAKESMIVQFILYLFYIFILILLSSGVAVSIASMICLISFYFTIYYVFFDRDIIKENVFFLTLGLLICPLAVATFGLLLANILFSINGIFVFFYYLISIFALTLYIIIKENINLNQLKVALEYNSAILTILVSSVIIYSYMNNDFSHLFNTFDSSIKKLDRPDLIEKSIVLISFPFLISNILTKTIVEHISYRRSQ
jgi:hypothetical protein